MKNVTFGRVDYCEIRRTRVSAFENKTEHPIVNNMESSNDNYLLMISKPRVQSQINNMVMIEAKRLIMNEKINTVRWKREQEVLDMELKKFQSELIVSRPKFCESQISHNKRSGLLCHHKELDSKKLVLSKTRLGECNNLNLDRVIYKDKDELQTDNCFISTEQNDSPLNTGSITVVIKDKPVIPSPEENLEIMRWVFNSLRTHVSDAKRLREVKAKIQQNIIIGKLRRFFNAWRDKVKQSKEFARKKREQCELQGVKKIELFVNLVKEKQKILEKNVKNKPIGKDKLNNNSVALKVGEKIGKPRKNFINPAEPLNNRLKVQKKIIAEQKIKLAEQNRVIEEMKLKQIEVESRISGIETINIAKTVLNDCGSRSRRMLMAQLIQANDDEKERKATSSVTFPERLEARAVTRKEKIRQRRIEQEKKLYEEKLKAEAIRLEEENMRKQSRRDAEREARVIREEQERKKAENAEKIRIHNELADKFYRKYLLRNYIVKPLILLVQIRRDEMLMATEHYNNSLLRKTLTAWKTEADQQLKIRFELSIFVYNRNLLWKYFRQWRETTKNEIRKYQVACDFNDLRLLEKYFRIWMTTVVENQMKYIENEKKAANFHEKMIKRNCFIQWKTYMTISGDVKESDKRRDQWRQLVQTVIPDFAPKYRGVLIDD